MVRHQLCEDAVTQTNASHVTAALGIQEFVVEPPRVLHGSHVSVIVGGHEVDGRRHVGVSAPAQGDEN